MEDARVLVVGVLVVLAVVLLAALSGVAASVAFHHVAERGERKRFLAELAPVRESVAELIDRWDAFYKRESKRDRDAAKQGAVGGGADSAPAPESSRAERIAALRARRLTATLPQVGRSRQG